MTAEAAMWQDVEFGSYTADLSLWEELADPGEGAVLELGAGSGRVALHLARAGISVVGIESDPALAAELAERARGEDLPVTVLRAGMVELDERWSQRSVPISAAIAPLHVVQQLEPGDRRHLLAYLAHLLPTGAPLAVVLVDETSLLEGGLEAGGVPDLREIDGWVYSSEPLWVQVGERDLKIRRLRTRVSPAGEVERSVHDDLLHRLGPEELESEARAAGFTSPGRRAVESGPSEADSLVVLLEAP